MNPPQHNSRHLQVTRTDNNGIVHCIWSTNCY